eukprot:2310593-Lingulodinium_polyedra.AAC.1
MENTYTPCDNLNTPVNCAWALATNFAVAQHVLRNAGDKTLDPWLKLFGNTELVKTRATRP